MVSQVWGLAIDFGTTATAAATCATDGRVAPLAMPDGNVAIPSSVFADGDTLLAGNEADNKAEYRLDAYEATPKRKVGQDTVLLGDNEFKPSALIGAVLAVVVDEALDQHDRRPPASIVLTHPVSWNTPARRRVLSEALESAAATLQLSQLPRPEFVPEPVAAAHWFGHHEPFSDGQYFAVYDLGGGTFDAAVLRQNGGYFDVATSGCIDPLGGFDFDSLLFKHLGETHIGSEDPQQWAALSSESPHDPTVGITRRRMLERVRYAKLGLTAQKVVRTPLPGLNSQIQITRDEYNDLISGLVDRTVDELEATIQEAELEPGQISAIYRIGGAARTPLVRTRLDRLHLPVRVEDNPKLVVAQGATLLAHRAFQRASGGGPETPETRVPSAPAKTAPRPAPRTQGIGRNLQRRWQDRQQRTWAPQASSGSAAALHTHVASAGIDSRQSYWSRLGLRAGQLNINRMMTIRMACLRIDDRFSITAERRPRALSKLATNSFNAYVAESQEASRGAGWLLWPPQCATVAGVSGGMEQWAQRSTDRNPQNVLHGYAQQGPYMIRVLIAQDRLHLRDRVFIDTARASHFAVRWSPSINVPIAVHDIAREEVAEEIAASVSVGATAAEITAELSPHGLDPLAAAESAKADIAARAPGSQILLDGAPDVFFGDKACLAYRFEWYPEGVGAPGRFRPPVTYWIWVGAIEDRTATITIQCPNPAVNWYALRDLVHLGTGQPEARPI